MEPQPNVKGPPGGMPKGLPPGAPPRPNRPATPPSGDGKTRGTVVAPPRPATPPDDEAFVPGPPPPPPAYNMPDVDKSGLSAQRDGVTSSQSPLQLSVKLNYESEDTEEDTEESDGGNVGNDGEVGNYDDKDEHTSFASSASSSFPDPMDRKIRPQTPTPPGETLPPPPPPPPLSSEMIQQQQIKQRRQRRESAAHSNFMSLPFNDDAWQTIHSRPNGLFRYCQRLKQVFLWLPSTCRWSKDQLVVAAARERIMDRLSVVSSKLVQILMDLRDALDDLEGGQPEAYDTRDDFWRWRFEQGWEKSDNNLKLAQNVDHCNQVLRASLMLLREYRGFLQFIVHKAQASRARNPLSGLRLSKARIRERAERMREKAELAQKVEEVRKVRARRNRKNLVEKQKMATQRVRSFQLHELYVMITDLQKRVRDPRIGQRLEDEFSPAWKSSIDTSQSYVYALRHVIKLESHLAERQRRQNAKVTCQKTLKRVRSRIRHDSGGKPTVFGPALAKLVHVKTASTRSTTTRPRPILGPARHTDL